MILRHGEVTCAQKTGCCNLRNTQIINEIYFCSKTFKVLKKMLYILDKITFILDLLHFKRQEST
jgi:hypothetical protein